MNAGVLVVAGSETTATTLTAVLFFLLTHKEAHVRLVTEVRNAFANEDEITIASVNKLEYLLACLNETMRILPAVPFGLPRMVPKGGRIMNGKLVPEDVSVSQELSSSLPGRVQFADSLDHRGRLALGSLPQRHFFPETL
jgi:cytochrome P450